MQLYSDEEVHDLATGLTELKELKYKEYCMRIDYSIVPVSHN